MISSNPFLYPLPFICCGGDWSFTDILDPYQPVSHFLHSSLFSMERQIPLNLYLGIRLIMSTLSDLQQLYPDDMYRTVRNWSWGLKTVGLVFNRCQPTQGWVSSPLTTCLSHQVPWESTNLTGFVPGMRRAICKMSCQMWIPHAHGDWSVKPVVCREVEMLIENGS